jgi:5-hydroxyisourate hydrolase
VTKDADHPAPTISTHVLDTERGGPAVGVHVTLYRLADDGRPLRIAQALTDADGRVRDLLERPLAVGDYRLEFDLAREIAVDPPAHDAPPAAVARMRDRPAAPPTATGGTAPERFFRRLTLDVRVTDTSRSYHVPLLLAPYSVTTYRGS